MRDAVTIFIFTYSDSEDWLILSMNFLWETDCTRSADEDYFLRENCSSGRDCSSDRNCSMSENEDDDQ